jgi:ribosomal protein L37AE/L43A
MSDQRIHLLLQYDEKYEDYDNKLIFPNGKELFLIGIDALEALVRSLVKGDQYIASEFETKFGKNCLSCKNRRSEYVMTKDWICHSCKKYKMHESLPNHYDTKLKVTFGAGTWSKKPIGGTFKIEKEIIEPLQRIHSLCIELGVEIFYV